MKNFAVDISIGHLKFRYATTRLNLRDSDVGRCGADIVLPYLPRVVSIDPFSKELSLDGKSPLPSIKLSIHDVTRELTDIFLTRVPEESVAVVRMLDSDLSEIDRLSGFITDDSWSDGVMTFTVRTDEDIEASDRLKYFSFDSFQYLEILSPVSVGVNVDIQVNESTPWRVFKTNLQRSAIAKQTFTYSAASVLGFNEYTGYTPTGAYKSRAFSIYPGLAFIKLATKTNQYDVIVPTMEDIDAGELNELPGLEKILKQQVAAQPLFNNTTENPSVYSYAIVGSSETNNSEMIAYAYCLKGRLWLENVDGSPGFISLTGESAEHYYLSGIPTEAYPDPANLIAGGVEAKEEFRDKFKIKSTHPPGEVIAQSVAFDQIYVDAGNLIPRHIDDPDLSVGLLWAGRTVTLEGSLFKGQDTGSSMGRTAMGFSRYYIAEVIEDVYDDVNFTGIIPFVLRVEIHNRPLSPRHYYAVDFSSDFPIFELPAEISMDTKLVTARFDYALSYIDLPLNNIREAAYDKVRELLVDGKQPPMVNRYRGARIDTINDVADLLQTVSRGQSDSPFFSQDNVQETNDAIINNANEKFAVCAKSEFILVNNEVFERLHLPARGGGVYSYSHLDVVAKRGLRRRTGYIADPDIFVDDTVGDNYISTGPMHTADWSNNITVAPSAVNLEDWSDNTFEFWEDKARNYFTSRRYRIIHDPIPENSSDLGKIFPIVFGRVYRVPLLHVISRKTIKEASSTAGDDLYVYASHACDVKSAMDIRLEWFPEDQGTNDDVNSLFDPNMVRDIARSPFPSSLSGHYEIEEAEGGVIKQKFVGEINSPYHKLQSVRTLDGYPVQGIKLRGDEWDIRANRMDKRYAIRNGLGSTPLYGTFSGYTNEDGRLVNHPIDVIATFLKIYGKKPFNESLVDETNFEIIKSQIPLYVASVYIDKPITSSEFIAKMCEEFGLIYFHSNGKLKFNVPDISFVRYDKPISEGLNLIEGMEDKSEGYKDIYTQINYEYKKNWVSDTYDSVVILNAMNNAACAAASKVNGQKKEKSVKADYVRSPYVAREVAGRYARILSGKRRKISCRVRYTEGIVFEPGDIVPVTYSDFSLDGALAIVSKVVIGRLVMELELFIIGGL